MAIRKIRVDGDPLLRKMSRPVEVFDKKLEMLVEDMIDTMREADGVGLAAPQVGILKRVFVVDLDDETGVKVLVNPKWGTQEGEQYETEGCLSVPGKSGRVKRPAYVKIEGQNQFGQPVAYEGHELLARAFCHEYDHLEGILFVDQADLDDPDVDDPDEEV